MASQFIVEDPELALIDQLQVGRHLKRKTRCTHDAGYDQRQDKEHGSSHGHWRRVNP